MSTPVLLVCLEYVVHAAAVREEDREGGMGEGVVGFCPRPSVVGENCSAVRSMK